MIDTAERFTVKIFVDSGAPELHAFVPVFHRWIQQQAVGRLLIDVSDYTHVPRGPGVMLVAHEAHYRMDGAGGRLGLLYARRRSLEGALAARLTRCLHEALVAAALLEHDLVGLRFSADEIEIGIDDRLAAPNDDATLGALRPALEPLLAKMYTGAPVSLERRNAPKACFSARIAGRNGGRVPDLLSRLGSLPREGS